MSYPSDPRLSAPSHYNRQECIDVMIDLCQFLARLPYVQPDQILYPPGGRWPNITKETMAPMGRTDEVVELLARLPYISIPTTKGRCPDPEDNWCPIFRDTWLIDFQGDGCQELLSKGVDFNAYPSIMPHSLDLPPHVISLTTGRSRGKWLLLDTTDGTITYWISVDFAYPQVYSADDPRRWRNDCGGETKPIKAHFRQVKKELETLTYIPFFRAGCSEPRLQIMYPEDTPQKAEKLKTIYQQYGWPDALRRDECRTALFEQRDQLRK